MSEHGTLWQPVSLDKDGLVLELRMPATALSLAQDLLRSKAETARVFARGQLTRGEEILARQTQLEAGERVSLRFHHGPSEAMTEEPLSDAAVDVVYQDELLLVVNKPAGLLIHGDGSDAETLTARVRGLLQRQGRIARVQAVQRLDVDTSGLVLFSLTEEFQPILDAQVAGHDMHKCYLAVIKGSLPNSHRGWLELTGSIARDRHDARKMRVGQSGKPSFTRVRTLQRHAGCSLLLVELGTGRKHQIRVHLSHAGCPILGDSLYGGASHPDGLMLHAWKESLVHPVTGECLTFQTTLPDRFTKLFPNQPSLRGE